MGRTPEHGEPARGHRPAVIRSAHRMCKVCLARLAGGGRGPRAPGPRPVGVGRNGRRRPGRYDDAPAVRGALDGERGGTWLGNGLFSGVAAGYSQ